MSNQSVHVNISCSEFANNSAATDENHVYQAAYLNTSLAHMETNDTHGGL